MDKQAMGMYWRGPYSQVNTAWQVSWEEWVLFQWYRMTLIQLPLTSFLSLVYAPLLGGGDEGILCITKHHEVRPPLPDLH